MYLISGALLVSLLKYLDDKPHKEVVAFINQLKLAQRVEVPKVDPPSKDEESKNETKDEKLAKVEDVTV